MNYNADQSGAPPSYFESQAEQDDSGAGTGRGHLAGDDKEVGIRLGGVDTDRVCTCHPDKCGCGCDKVTMDKNITVLHG